MNALRSFRFVLTVVLALALIGGAVTAQRTASTTARTHITAYFENSNGIFRGDEVRILGVPVGRIDSIEPQPQHAKIRFWLDNRYKVPADAMAVIVSPTLVTARAIELTPAYTGGPVLPNNAVIAQNHTAVPVEWDDFRVQLQKLTDLLKPTRPGGVSTLGAFINTTADNLRGRGSDIRNAIIKLSQVFSALGDHSGDIFSTIQNLSILVSALHDSTDLLGHLNQNLASVAGLLANDPDKVAQAVSDLNSVVGDVSSFVADNREALGTTSDKLASIVRSLAENLDDLKQALHIVPNTFANFIDIYEPAQGAIAGALAINNFANPISFVCSAIQAAARLGAQQTAKLCVQYLAPIVKNRQYNFLPLGQNLLVGAAARPNEVTYSEDWLRPDFVPPATSPPPSAPPASAGSPPQSGRQSAPPPATGPAVPAPLPVTATPAAGLPGLMMPPGSGS